MNAPLSQNLSHLERTVCEAINETDWLELTSTMVVTGQPDSENPLDPDMPSGSEEAIALFVAERLRGMGLEVELHAKQPRRPNVIGTLAGPGDGPVLIVNDHLDTYPAGSPAG
jgi:acetylornithine deacetylase